MNLEQLTNILRDEIAARPLSSHPDALYHVPSSIAFGTEIIVAFHDRTFEGVYLYQRYPLAVHLIDKYRKDEQPNARIGCIDGVHFLHTVHDLTPTLSPSGDSPLHQYFRANDEIEFDDAETLAQILAQIVFLAAADIRDLLNHADPAPKIRPDLWPKLKSADAYVEWFNGCLISDIPTSNTKNIA